MRNRAGKKQKYICRCRAVKGLAAVIQRGMAAALVFMLCFFMAFTVPAQAASSGSERHEDTQDYCLRAHDVTVYMSELQGLDAGQKKALVENASGYAFYTWRITYRAWADRVSGSGDFSGVNWDQEGSYKITVRMPALTEENDSVITYTLTIVDDLPEPEPEPEPPAPVTYRVTVRFLEEETGEALKDAYVSGEMEEGSPFEIGADILLLPEGYTVAEIQGDLAGEMISDREILIICRRREIDPQEPVEPENPDDPGKEGQGSEEKPGNDTGITNGDHSGSGSSGSSSTSGKTSGKTSGSNSGKTSGSSKGSGSGKSGSNTSSGSKSSTGKTTKTPSAASQAAAQTASQAAVQSENSAAQTQTEEASPAEETAFPTGESVLPAEETEIPETVVTEIETEEAPLPAQEKADAVNTALAEGEGGDGQAALGGAVLPQTQAQKEKYPLWSLAVGTAEAGVLAVLSCMILSDLKLIMWFENKKKRR